MPCVNRAHTHTHTHTNNTTEIAGSMYSRQVMCVYIHITVCVCISIWQYVYVHPVCVCAYTYYNTFMYICKSILQYVYIHACDNTYWDFQWWRFTDGNMCIYIESWYICICAHRVHIDMAICAYTCIWQYLLRFSVVRHTSCNAYKRVMVYMYMCT